MSIALMTEAWKAEMPTGRKFVLLALCDNANDQGECYPSIQTIAGKCSMCERAVQGHLADLEQAGMVVRAIRKGRSTLYRIDPRRFCTPAENAPLQIMHPTPADFAPITVKEPSVEPSSNRQGGGAQGKGQGNGNRKQERKNASRLSPDWRASDDDWQFATDAGFEPEAVSAIEATFRDYWLAKPGADGTKLDWAATWRNWVRRECGQQPSGRRGGAGGGGRRPSRTTADAFAELLAETAEGHQPRAGLRHLQGPAGGNPFHAGGAG